MKQAIKQTEILNFLSNHLRLGTDEVKMDSDIYKDFGIDGDDFFELMEAYSKEFKVDLSDFLWYFHHNEEGFFNIGSIFVKPPYNRVSRIAITPQILFEAANTGKWSIKYPKHTLPKKRYDILIGWFFLIIIFILIWI